jgi:hypothetical protein
MKTYAETKQSGYEAHAGPCHPGRREHTRNWKDTGAFGVVHFGRVLQWHLGLSVGCSPAPAPVNGTRRLSSFSGPIEISEQVLDAGTYVFKLADSASDRNIVQVFSKNERHQ